MMKPLPDGRYGQTVGVVGSTVRTATGPCGPVKVAPVMRRCHGSLTPSAKTMMLKPVRVPRGSPTASPGTNGNSCAVSAYGTRVTPFPGTLKTVGRFDPDEP